ncbi:succinate dehydrogenase flavoprotein subunit [Gloeomargarita lithophora Alchichica-D10]|uniref:succinate dehydrogenase n=1 Tax=Gloeomargarita lithophora Alchichica-D10 TaxID=1188229 RepID=A0A1J0AF57_9CYAN|nr:fumarate reductase/succinate dehydrogenase flavoprotein subunit [Gloeomargarita lithophora]APB34557.1 succinate dehydrogenase flavoprotein subunit [Gloeomargarita lithophora Alchichica-D10]
MISTPIPNSPLPDQWDEFKNHCRLVSPANRGKYTVLVIGTGLAGASAAATLGELGYNVLVFCLQDTPRRAHSIAAQGGINAAKNYQNDGDSVWRLFYDTIKGGDFRAREANVYRLAQISTQIIDHCVAQGVPFAREYGGLLANRSFGGAQVSRTFYARGQTGQQLLLGAYGALMRQVHRGTVQVFPQRELRDLVLVDGRAQGIIMRNLITGALERYGGHAVILASGGYGNIYYLSTNAKSANASAVWRCHKRGADLANPSFVQIHPTCIPVSGTGQSKLTLMSESLRNDGRIWVAKNPGDSRLPQEIFAQERDYFLERLYPSFGNLVPRDIASRTVKNLCDQGYGVGRSVYLDFQEHLAKNRPEIERKYGNLFTMYERITGENPYETPMRIYPAVHYVMGGLWVDYGLMSTIPGLFVLGEANFSDHGANRLGASALMQGLADGYFIIPYTLGNYLAGIKPQKIDSLSDEFNQAEQQTQAQIAALLSVQGSQTPMNFHRELGLILWDQVGMSRSETGLKDALQKINNLQQDFWQNVRVTGSAQGLNQALEYAGRVADYLELAQVLTWDALARQESCGAHFREEYQTPDGEALRDDERFSHVALWRWGEVPVRSEEPLDYRMVQPSVRNYR